MKAHVILSRWRNRVVETAPDQNGALWVPKRDFQDLLRDLDELAIDYLREQRSMVSAARRAKKLKKRLKASRGDGPVKGVAEQALGGTKGANARSAATKAAKQSQSVSLLSAPANEAGNSGAVGQTSGSPRSAGYANGSLGVEGRQSLHPISFGGAA